MDNTQKYWYLPLTFSGRLNRLRYFLALLLAMSVYCLTSIPLEFFGINSMLIHYPIFILYMVWCFSLLGRRLHDIGISAWFSLISLVPFVNLGLGLFLLFKKGNAGPNKYGPDPLGKN